MEIYNSETKQIDDNLDKSTPILTKDKAIELWRGNGFKKIQYKLDKSYPYKPMNNIMDNPEMIEGHDGMYNVSDIINVLKNNMVKSDKSITYYRGGGGKKTTRFIKKKTFISVTDHIEDAISFLDDTGSLYNMIVDKNVKRLKTGVENETLLENNCCIEYTNIITEIEINGRTYQSYQINVHPPDYNCNKNSIVETGETKKSSHKKNLHTNVVDEFLKIIPEEEYELIDSPEDVIETVMTIGQTISLDDATLVFNYIKNYDSAGILIDKKKRKKIYKKKKKGKKHIKRKKNKTRKNETRKNKKSKTRKNKKSKTRKNKKK